MKTDRKLLKEFCVYLNIHCKQWWKNKQNNTRYKIKNISIEEGYDYLSIWIDWLITKFNYSGFMYKSQLGNIHSDDRKLIIDKIWVEIFKSGKI